MAKYVVFYKGWYHEHDEWFDEEFEASTPLEALQAFLESHRVRRKARLNGEYKWWHGDWFNSYRGIDSVDENERQECPRCHGLGTIPTRKPVKVDTM